MRDDDTEPAPDFDFLTYIREQLSEFVPPVQFRVTQGTMNAQYGGTREKIVISFVASPSKTDRIEKWVQEFRNFYPEYVFALRNTINE